MQLRSYQQEAVQSIIDSASAGYRGPLVVMPTGTGKSAVIGCFIKEVMEAHPRTRHMVLTHVKELVGQNAKALEVTLVGLVLKRVGLIEPKFNDRLREVLKKA